MNKMKLALFIYFVVIFVEKSQSCVIGDPCEHNFIPGTYSLDNQCPYFLRLHSEETYDHTWCGFQGKRAIICCPEDGVAARSNFDSIDEKTKTMESLCKNFKVPSETNSVRILGGKESLVGEFPHYALLGYRKGEESNASFDCGGTLISNKHVLTAAHCCRKSSGLSFVRLGAVSFSLFLFEVIMLLFFFRLH